MSVDKLERDRYLTEAMGELKQNPYTRFYDFSTWQGFGKLWEFAQKQDWFEALLVVSTELPDYQHLIDIYSIHPDRFADAVYHFLKEEVADG